MMKGLLYKDLCTMRSQGKIYLFLALFWGGMAFLNRDGSFFSGMAVMLGVMAPLTAFAYDERAKFDAMMLTFPLGREMIVRERYVFAVLSVTAFDIAGLLFSLLIRVEAPLLQAAAFWGVGIWVLSFLLPLLFRFGSEKARYLMMAVVLLPVAAIWLLAKGGVSVPEGMFVTGMRVFPAVSAAAMAVSYRISVGIYRKTAF